MRILIFGFIILVTVPVFAADNATADQTSPQEITPTTPPTSTNTKVDPCTQLANNIVAEFHQGLNTDSYDAMTSLQHIQVFMAHRAGLQCENTPAFLAGLAKVAADKYQIAFNFEKGVTPDKVLICNAIIDSATASYIVGANPEHGIAPDGDSILSMVSTEILTMNYYNGDCKAVLGDSQDFVNKILENYEKSKLNKKVENQGFDDV